MIDLDKASLDLECPCCKFSNPFFYRQARLRAVIICRGCKTSIRLDDQMNTCRKAHVQAQRAIAALQETLSKLSTTITIKL